MKNFKEIIEKAVDLAKAELHAIWESFDGTRLIETEQEAYGEVVVIVFQVFRDAETMIVEDVVIYRREDLNEEKAWQIYRECEGKEFTI